MLIGLISDVHGNLPALEAVLDDMPDVDAVVCAGDIVGYNPWPAACVDRVRAVASVCVSGNHDRTVENPRRYRAHDMAYAGLKLAKTQLDSEQRAWLQNQPLRTTIADGQVQLVHSHPDPDMLGTYVYPDEVEELGPYLEDTEGVVFGHTHQQHADSVAGSVVVNPGSVGQPRDGNPDAAYALLDTADFSVDLRRVSYAVEQVVDRIEELDLPGETGRRLRDGT